MRGRTADTPTFGEAALSRSFDLSRRALETRAREAHRAYIEALRSWEALWRRSTCPSCDCDGVSDDEGQLRCDEAEAEAEKERQRITFRDLCEELGYIPSGLIVGLRAREPQTAATSARKM